MKRKIENFSMLSNDGAMQTGKIINIFIKLLE